MREHDSHMHKIHPTNELLVDVKHVSKKFCRSLKRSLWYGVQDIAAELTKRKRSVELRQDEFWALHDISFELRRGECLGIIGPNGAGKSTLLKMLNGLIKLDQGRIHVRGRIGALLELGIGFNPILTGRENIYINGAILGFNKSQIDHKLDRIVEFSELYDFLDSPVQNYSSGMKVRLGFAIAAQMEPDILIIDEVLAVGDIGFRAKCYDAIADIAKKAAIIFVSHTMSHITRICSHVLVLEKGTVAHYGDVNAGVNRYLQSFKTDYVSYRTGNGKVNVLQWRFLNAQGEEATNFLYDTSFTIELELTANETVGQINVIIAFFDKNQNLVAECNSFVQSYSIDIRTHESLKIRIRLEHLILNAGEYKISLLLLSSNMLEHYDWLHYVSSIFVKGKVGGAPQQYKPTWEIIRL